jgi:hypothetical protein
MSRRRFYEPPQNPGLQRHLRWLAVVGACLCLCVPSRAIAQTADEPADAAHSVRSVGVESVGVESVESATAALEPHVVVLSPERVREADEWTRAFTAWQEWAEQWMGRRQPGRWAYAVDRMQEPDPPAWLEDACTLLSAERELSTACNLLASWRLEPWEARSRKVAAAAVAQQEAPTKSTWWRHLHLDGLSSTTQSNISAVGLFGAHFTIDVAGRLQLFAAPGILVVSVPNLRGERDLWPATDFGFSYRLFDLGRASIHGNLVHAWMIGNRAALVNPNLVLAGFSITFKPQPH